MDIKQIIYFVEVADKESYSVAAKELSVSQPTLSVAIKKLEKELGLSLFYYNLRKMRLTDEGKIFYSYARDYLSAYNRMMERSRCISKEIIGSIRIIAAPVFSKMYLGELLALYHKKYPGVVIHVEGKGNTTGLELLSSRDADFAMKMLPIDGDTYEMIPMVSQKLRLGVFKNHRLAGRTSVSFRELSNESFLVLSDDYSLQRQFMKNCSEAGFTPNVVLSGTDCDFLASLVGHNWGVFLTGQSVWDSVDTRDIHLLDITDADVSWNLVLASRKGKRMSNAALAFAELARQYFKSNQ